MSRHFKKSSYDVTYELVVQHVIRSHFGKQKMTDITQNDRGALFACEHLDDYILYRNSETTASYITQWRFGSLTFSVIMLLLVAV